MNVGQLTIDIAANVARLKADMDSAKKVVNEAMGDITKAVEYAKAAFVTLGGVTSFAALQGIVTGGIEAKSKLYDLSVQTGITVEALSGLGKVAKYSNTDLNDIAGASNKLAKSLFTQNEESKGAAQALKALGLDFDTFKRMQPQEQLVALAGAMGQFEDGSEKSAAAMLLWGKTGADLLPFMKELEERGYAVGKQTTASAEMAKKYEDNLVTLKIAADAWKRTLVEAVLPTMIDITDAFIDARKEVDSFNVVGAGIKVVFETLAVLGANVAFVFKGVGREIGAIAAQAMALARGDFAGAAEIRNAVIEDGKQARAELDATEARLMGLKSKITTAGDFQRGDKDTSPVRRPRLGLQPGEDKTSTAAVVDGYDALIARIRSKVELDQLELETNAKVTDAEKFRIEIYKEVEKNFAKLSVDKMVAIDQETELAIAVIKAHEAWEAEAKWVKEATDANASYVESQMQLRDQLQAQARDAAQQLRTYGMTTEELQALETARLRDAAAALEQRAAQADNAYLEDNARLYREQADALRATADAREQLASKEAFDRENPLSGMSRAVKEYLRDITRAGDATYSTVANSLHGLEDIGVAALSGGDARSAAKQWVSGIIAEIERLYVVRPLMQQIFGDGSGGGSGGGWLGAVLNLAGAFFGGSGMSIDTSGYAASSTGYASAAGISGGRAGGGRAEAGKQYMVGEDGPELLRMGSQSGTVVPRQKPNVQIHNYNGSAVSTQEDDDGTLHVLLEKAAQKGAERGYNRAIGDIKSGTGKFADALRSRGVGLGNAALRHF